MMVHRSECEDCGNQVEWVTRGGDLRCDDCGGDMETAGKSGVVRGPGPGLLPVGDLRRVLDDVRDTEYDYGYDDEQAEIATTVRDDIVARLEDLIDEYQIATDHEDSADVFAYVYEATDLLAVVTHPDEVRRYQEETPHVVNLTPEGRDWCGGLLAAGETAQGGDVDD